MPEISNDMVGPVIFLVAGEPSGDHLGAALMRGLRMHAPGVQFYGVGGPAMQAEGMTSIFPMSDLSIMGLAEVLPRLPLLFRRINETVKAAIELSPDACITIDAPDFNFRVARRLHGKGFPLVHYVAPTVWAWRAGRAKKIARFLDHLLALLPFEPPYFEREGLACTFVGHPVLDSGLDLGDGTVFRAKHNIAPNARVLCVLPGSRIGEVERLLPIFGEVIDRLSTQIKSLHVLVPTVSTTERIVHDGVSQWPVPVSIIADSNEKADAFAASDGALAASGTIVLELAVAGVPAVIGYRFNALTTWIARRIVRTPYASLVNIALNRYAIPECLLNDCTAENLTREVKSILMDPDARQAQLDAYDQVKDLFRVGTTSPGEQAALTVLRVTGYTPASP